MQYPVDTLNQGRIGKKCHRYQSPQAGDTLIPRATGSHRFGIVTLGTGKQNRL